MKLKIELRQNEPDRARAFFELQNHDHVLKGQMAMDSFEGKFYETTPVTESLVLDNGPVWWAHVGQHRDGVYHRIPLRKGYAESKAATAEVARIVDMLNEAEKLGHIATVRDVLKKAVTK